MKKAKKFVLLVTLLTLLTPVVGAQVRIDPLVTVPVRWGATWAGITNGQNIEIILPFPEVQMHYVLGGDGPIRVGFGARVFTWILESMITPNVFVEAEISNIVLNASLGGFGYGFFGLVQTGGWGAVILPEGSLEWKATDNFRLGAGALFFGDYKNIDQYNLYALFIRARFPILVK